MTRQEFEVVKARAHQVLDEDWDRAFTEARNVDVMTGTKFQNGVPQDIIRQNIERERPRGRDVTGY